MSGEGFLHPFGVLGPDRMWMPSNFLIGLLVLLFAENVAEDVLEVQLGR